MLQLNKEGPRNAPYQPHPKFRGTLVSASRNAVDFYNTQTGDRRLRHRVFYPITCFDYSLRTTIGTIVACGTESGTVLVYNAVTGAELREIRTNGQKQPDVVVDGDTAAMELTALGDATAVPTGTPDVVVTAIMLPGINTLFAGHSDGSVRVFTLDSLESKVFTSPDFESMDEAAADGFVGGDSGKADEGDADESSGGTDSDAAGTPRAPDARSAGREVVGLAVLKERGTLTVGHANGTLHFYDVSTTDWRGKYKARGHLRQLVALPQFGSVLAVHDDSTSVALWDMSSDRPLTLDFKDEMKAKGEADSKITCAAYDDDRATLFLACTDGSVFVHKMSKGEDDALTVRLVRVCKRSYAAGTAASPIVALAYDSVGDALLTGDGTGLVRIVPNVTGVKYSETATSMRSVAEATRADSEALTKAFASDRGGGGGGGTSSTAASPPPRAPAVSESGAAGGSGGAADSVEAAVVEAPTPPGSTGAAGVAPGGGSDGAALESTGTEVEWTHGSFEVQTLGAMLGPVAFSIGEGRVASPLYVAPWPSAGSLPPILQRLRGEFPCVPFGNARPVPALKAGWAVPSDADEGLMHGPCANSLWAVVERGDDFVTLECEYPDDHAISKVRRTLRSDADSPAVDISLEVFARREVSLPLGFSVMLTLGEKAFGSTVEAPSFAGGLTFPGLLEPGEAPAFTLKPGGAFKDLSTVPMATTPGSPSVPVDLSRLPLDADAEACLQLCKLSEGGITVRHSEGYLVRVTWDVSALPNAMLHISNNGRSYAPWNGSHTALTISPVAAAFDLGTAFSAGSNPMNKKGVPTAVELSPSRDDEPSWSTTYRIECEATEVDE